MDSKDKKQVAIALIIFASLSFVAVLVLNGVSTFFFNAISGGVIAENLPPEGGIVGPIAIDRDRTVLQITVVQSIEGDDAWNQVEGAVLDEQKNQLFSFGKEFWKESGYDDGGWWEESKTDYTIKVFLQRGTYYLGFQPERIDEATGAIGILAQKKMGGVMPLFIGGVIALILGVILYQMAAASTPKTLRGSGRLH